MKKFLLASAVVLGIAGTASAADLPVRAPVYAPPPVFSWTGCYIGGHVGYGKGQSSQNFQFDDVTNDFNTAEYYFTNNFENKGGVYGGQAGCNYELGRFVFGLEGDWSAANLKASYSFTDPAAADSASFSSKVDSLASIRGRFGIAEDRVFLYATMGWGWAKFKYSYALNDSDTGTAAGSFSTTADGIVLGAGVNYALTDWLILRAEYLHYAFGKDFNLTPSFLVNPAFDTGPGFNDHVTLKNVDVIRIGADWKFNFWGAPAVARY
jgi:outer membrane immunogenic protein